MKGKSDDAVLKLPSRVRMLTPAAVPTLEAPVADQEQQDQNEGRQAFHVSSLYVTSSYSLVDQKMELSTSFSSKLRHRKLSSP